MQSPSTEPPRTSGAWTASGPGLAGNSTLGAWDGDLFFDLQVSNYGEEAWVWDANNGACAVGGPVTGDALWPGGL